MDITELCTFLLNTDQLSIQDIQIENGQILVLVESTRQKASCPCCGKESTKVHSHYLRYPLDLPWSQTPVILHLQAKRFFCVNDQCPKRTFAERFPGYVDWYALRTLRVKEKQERIGLSVSALMAEGLLKMEQMRISDTT